VIEGYNITYRRTVETRYDKLGGKYVFNSNTTFGRWLTGVPNPPDLGTVSKIIESDLLRFFKSYWYNRLTEFDGVKEIITEKYPFNGCDHFFYPGEYSGLRVKLKVKVAYTAVNGNSKKLEKYEDIFELTLLRDGLNQPWNTMGIEGGYKGDKKSMPLSSTDLTPEELSFWECNTIGMKYMIEHASDEYNKLPEIVVPEFNSGEEMIWFTHRFLRTAGKDEIRKYLWTYLSPNYFSKCGDFILSDKAEDLIESILSFTHADRGSYKDTYCDYPQVKEQAKRETSHSITYYAKTGGKFSRIQVAYYNGKLKIVDMSLGKYREEKELEALELVPEDKCLEFAPATWKRFETENVKGVSTVFPTEPVFDQKTQSLTARYKGAEYTLKAEILDKSLTSQIKQASQRPATAKIWAENFRKNLGAQQVGNPGSFIYNKTEGVEYTWKISANRQETTIRYRSILYNDGYYQMWIAGSTGSAEENQFFDQFEVK